MKNKSVTIFGLGGLGSNVAIQLARIGIGTLYLIDHDFVEEVNLNRQYYFLEDVGKRKTLALQQIIKRINADINVQVFNSYIDEHNVKDFCDYSDIVVEAFDQPKAKALLINCVLGQFEDKVVVSASGIAGYGGSNNIVTKKINEQFYLIGDGIEPEYPVGSMLAPRVTIAASHQANLVLSLLLNEENI